jgi:CheY-like chemotaxis protein
MAAVAAMELEAAPRGVAAASVLIADHSLSSRTTLRSMLSEAGHDVVGEAWSGAEALALSLALQPDVILLDANLPDLDSVELLGQLGELAVPAIATAALWSEQRREACRDLGVATLATPIRAADLREAIDSALRVEELGVAPARPRAHARAPSLRASIALTVFPNAGPSTRLPKVPSTTPRSRPLTFLPSRTTTTSTSVVPSGFRLNV